MLGIKCVRSAASVVGAGEAWLKRNGALVQYESPEEAQAEVRRLNERMSSPNVWYMVEKI